MKPQVGKLYRLSYGDGFVVVAHGDVIRPEEADSPFAIGMPKYFDVMPIGVSKDNITVLWGERLLEISTLPWTMHKDGNEKVLPVVWEQRTKPNGISGVTEKRK